MWGNQKESGNFGGSYGGDQGGGYLNSPGNFGSPSMSQGGAKTRQRAQSMVPCTCANILNAKQEEDRFLDDAIDLHQVTVVGIIRSVKESATRLDYELDDMTGPLLDIRQFVDNDEGTPDEERTPPMRENTYVRAFGHVRSFSEKRYLVAFKLIQIVDLNELTTHILEVMQNRIALKKTASAVPQETMGSMNMSTANSYPGAEVDNGLSNVQKQVSAVIKSCNDETGVHIDIIKQRCQGIPLKAIIDTLDFLSSEGHIYSTVDDEHFKSTDS